MAAENKAVINMTEYLLILKAETAEWERDMTASQRPEWPEGKW